MRHKIAVTVDCAVFGLDQDGLKILLIKRGIAPFKGRWALPGGFVRRESVEEAARRELKEETGLDGVFLEQLYTFGSVDRDPRQHTVTVAWYALTHIAAVQAATDASSAAWFAEDELPKLAFDHQAIFDVARERLRGKVRYRPIGFELLPKRFTLTELQRLYEVVLGRDLDKRNFRKKVLAMDFLVDTGELERNVPRRPARLYRFDRRKYRALERGGFEMWV